jgi:hypothetical protein
MSKFKYPNAAAYMKAKRNKALYDVVMAAFYEEADAQWVKRIQEREEVEAKPAPRWYQFWKRD